MRPSCRLPPRSQSCPRLGSPKCVQKRVQMCPKTCPNGGRRQSQLDARCRKVRPNSHRTTLCKLLGLSILVARRRRMSSRGQLIDHFDKWSGRRDSNYREENSNGTLNKPHRKIRKQKTHNYTHTNYIRRKMRTRIDILRPAETRKDWPPKPPHFPQICATS
jgi:hypothetical protein